MYHRSDEGQNSHSGHSSTTVSSEGHQSVANQKREFTIIVPITEVEGSLAFVCLKYPNGTLYEIGLYIE